MLEMCSSSGEAPPRTRLRFRSQLPSRASKASKVSAILLRSKVSCRISQLQLLLSSRLRSSSLAVAIRIAPLKLGSLVSPSPRSVSLIPLIPLLPARSNCRH